MARAALEGLQAEIAKLLGRDGAALARGAQLERLEGRYLMLTLFACGGSVPTAARLLGVHRRTLERHLSPKKPARRTTARRKK